jgi:hypothetical protein
MSQLKDQITDAMKNAMRAKDKERLGTVRLILAELKRIEVDERIELDDERIIAIMDKMLKQRRDSISQFEDAGRQDLADTEKAELAVIQSFMPAALSEEEVSQLVAEAIADTDAQSMKDMGKVMAQLKPQLQGRADMAKVSKLIKARLS